MIDFKPLYIYKEVDYDGSYSLEDAILRTNRITVKKNFIAEQLNDQNMPFHEIDIWASPAYDENRCDILLPGILPKSMDISLVKFEKQYIDTIADCLFRSWDNTRLNVFFHSAGYDTRLLSAILYKLTCERGPEWLGKVVFLIREPEAKYAVEIIQRIGWHRFRIPIYVYPYEYENSIGFLQCGKNVGGCSEYPVNIFLEPLRYYFDQEKDDLNVILGLWGNEPINAFLQHPSVDKGNDRYMNFYDLYEMYAYSRIARFMSAIPYQVINPFTNANTLRLLMYSNIKDFDIRKLKRPQDIRNLILSKFFGNIANIPNVPMKEVYKTRSVNNIDLLSIDFRYSHLKDMTVKAISEYGTPSSKQWWSLLTLASFLRYMEITYQTDIRFDN